MSLLNCAPLRLPYAPYPSLIRACGPARLSVLTSLIRLTRLHDFTLINKRPTRLCPVFCCVVTTERFMLKLFCVCAPINHSPPVSLFSFVLPNKAALQLFFSFFHFKPLVTLLFTLFCNNIFKFSVLFFF